MAGPTRLFDFYEADNLAAADVEAKADWRVGVHVFSVDCKRRRNEIQVLGAQPASPAEYLQIGGRGRLIKTKVPKLRLLDGRTLLLGMPAIIRQDELKWYHTSKLLCVCSVELN